jgi:hypothetical protein
MDDKNLIAFFKGEFTNYIEGLALSAFDGVLHDGWFFILLFLKYGSLYHDNRLCQLLSIIIFYHYDH